MQQPHLPHRCPKDSHDQASDIIGSIEDFCFTSFVFSLRPRLCYIFSMVSVIITKDKLVLSSTFLSDNFRTSGQSFTELGIDDCHTTRGCSTVIYS
jgi:hypothetical protein